MKKLFTIVLFWLLPILVMAQFYKTESTILSRGEDMRLETSHIDENGNLYLCFFTTGLTVVSDQSGRGFRNTNRDMLISKYDNEHKFLNGFTISGNSTVLVRSMVTDSEGFIYVGGLFIGTVEFGRDVELVALNAEQAFIAKYTPSGGLEWAHQFGNRNFIQGVRDLKIVNNKLFAYILHSGETDFDPGEGEVVLEGAKSHAFLELDLDGNFINVVSDLSLINRNHTDIDEDENLIVAGAYFGRENFSYQGSEIRTANHLGDDAFIAKYNKDRELDWINVFGVGSSTESLGDFVVNSDGVITVIGKIESQQTIGGESIPANSFIVQQYSSSGDLLRTKRLTHSNPRIFKMVNDSNNNVHLIGIFEKDITISLVSGADTTLVAKEGVSNRFLMSLNSDLEVSGIAHIASDITSIDLQINSTDHLYSIVGVESDSDIFFGKDSILESSSATKVLTERLQLLLLDGTNVDEEEMNEEMEEEMEELEDEELEEEELEEEELEEEIISEEVEELVKVMNVEGPWEFLLLVAEDKKIESVKLYQSNNLIYNSDLNSNAASMNTREFPPGNYLLKVQTNEGVMEREIVIE